MAAEILQIKITADNKEAIGAMRDTIAGLNGVSVAAGKSGAAMTKSATNYQNFGRVIQDLPYGFNGIANNLTQLIPSVGMLGLAFSGVVTALTFMQIGFGAWTRGMGGAKKSVEDLEKAMDGFRESAAKEIVQFRELQSVASNANIPMVQRIQAVEKLQKEYPAFLGNLSKEQILAGDIGNAYDKILGALKAKIALQAAEEKVIPLIKEQLEIFEKLETAKKKVANVAGITEADLKASEKFASETGKAVSPLKALQAEAIAASKDVGTLSAEYNVLNTKIDGVFKSMQPFIKASNDLNQEHEKEKKLLFDIIKYREKMNGQFQESLFAAPEVFAPKEKAQKMEAGLPTSVAQIDKMIAEARLKNMQKIREQQQEDAEAQEQAIIRQADLYMGVLSPAIDNMFNSLANGESVLDSLGDMFEQLAVQIAASLAKAAALAGIVSLLSGGKIKFGDAFKGIMNLQGFATGGTVSGPESGYPVMLHGTEHIVRPDQMKSIISEAAMRGMSNMQGSGGIGDIRIMGEFKQRGQDMVAVIDRTNVSLGLRRG
jgi:hypothetical protein